MTDTFAMTVGSPKILSLCFLWQIKGMVAIARPYRACREIENSHELTGHIVLIERGDCMFVDKVNFGSLCHHIHAFMDL